MNPAPARFALLTLIAGLTAGCSSLEPCPSPVTVPPLPGTDVDAVLFLIGDAGAADPAGEPVLEALASEVEKAVADHGADRVRVVFLGDNIYPAGLPRPGTSGYDRARRRLDAEIAVVAGLASPPSPVALFVPGNHDWDHNSGGGLDRVRDQEAYLAEHGGGRAAMLPGRGCPGPVAVDVGDRLRVLALDTHWWLRGGVKPEGPSSGCDAGSEGEVARLVAEALEAGERRVVVVGHHPFVSGGPHGGATLFLRRLGLVPQDISGSRYRRMIASLEGAFASNPPVVYAAGHEHSLQLLTRGGLPYYAVSGSGSSDNVTAVGALDETVFCREGSGFMRLDVARDGRVRLGAYLAGAPGAPLVELFSTELAGHPE